MEVEVPASVAYNCYSDREAIPRWMPFISSVKVALDTAKWLFRSALVDRIKFPKCLIKFFPMLEQK